MIVMRELTLEDYVILYFLFAGIINSLYFVKVIQFRKDYEDLIRDLVWNSGLKDEFFHWMTFIIAFVCGGWQWPKTILKWTGVIKEEKK